MEKKFFENVEEINNLLEEKDVKENSLVQAVILDKQVFATEAEAMEFAADKGFSFENVEETDKQYLLTQFDVEEFDVESFREVEIRRGVMVIVGLVKPMPVEAPDFFLSLRNNDDAMKFSDSLPHIIELAKVVNGFHANYGEVKITTEMLLNMERNFNERVVGVDLMIDYDHDQREAAGWVKEVFLSEDKTTMYGVVRWTPKGAVALADRSFRYFSPEFSLNYVHPHTGVVHGPTLLGGGLVNRPFLKMDAIVGLNNKKEGVNMDTISLSDHNAKLEVLNVQLSEMKANEEKTVKVVEGLKEENVKLSEELKELKEAKAQAELEAKNEKLFTEGKINKAQLTALNEGKDFYEVIALAETMNNAPKGENSEGNTIELSEADKKVCTMLDLSPEEFVKYNA